MNQFVQGEGQIKEVDPWDNGTAGGGGTKRSNHTPAEGHPGG